MELGGKIHAVAALLTAKSPRPNLREGFMDPRDCLNAAAKREITAFGNWTPSIQTVTSQYIIVSVLFWLIWHCLLPLIGIRQYEISEIS
jgi:hypothetical protein